MGEETHIPGGKKEPSSWKKALRQREKSLSLETREFWVLGLITKEANLSCVSCY